MAFSAADHLKSCIAVPEGAPLGKLVIFRSSNAPFYFQPLFAKKRPLSNDTDLHPLFATYQNCDFARTLLGR